MTRQNNNSIALLCCAAFVLLLAINRQATAQVRAQL